MYKTEIIYFEQKIDWWVLESIKSGKTNFDDILKVLPGVYPTHIRDSIKRLVSNGMLTPSLINSEQNNHSEKTLLSSHLVSHVPHPLDYDWRFNRDTTTKLLRQLNLLTSINDKIAMLGTPSLLTNELSRFRRHFLFVDKNIESQNKKPSNISYYQCDIMREPLPQIQVNAVLADPPWYPEFMRGFIWAASKITRVGGYAIFCLPPEGTRPSISSEISEFIRYAQKIGFNLSRYIKGQLSYSAPLFEINSLRAEGFTNIKKDWRQGDLALFYKSKKNNFVRPTIPVDEDWIEIKIMDVRIKIRANNSRLFQDPSLISIVRNDILPSVSRRDNRRNSVNVWTSGNRVFRCNGTNILYQIILARSLNLSPIYLASTLLKRALSIEEIVLISSTVKQVDKLINVEQKEIDEYYFN